MNNHIKILLLAVSVIASSCTKSPVPEGTASLVVVNAMVGTTSLLPNFKSEVPLAGTNGIRLLYGQIISQNNRLSSYSNTCNLSFFEYPNITKSLFNVTIDLPVGSVHSLMLTGTSTQPDTVFTADKIPYYGAQDSTAGIRFVNLSAQSLPVSINLKGSANGNVVGSLPYKAVTEFKAYSANSKVSSYIFEFRDAVKGTLISTYTASKVGVGGTSSVPNYWMFKNNTLALIGTPGSTGTYAQKVLLINNF